MISPLLFAKAISEDSRKHELLRNSNDLFLVVKKIGYMFENPISFYILRCKRSLIWSL